MSNVDLTKQKNKAGYIVIPISQADVIAIFKGFGICDHCSDMNAKHGYLCPVLGERWYCDTCHDEWESNAKFYPEDLDYEEMVTKRMLGAISRYKAIYDV